MSEPNLKARRLSLYYDTDLGKQGWEKRSKCVYEKVVDRDIGQIFLNDVKQEGGTCGFHTLYYMAIVSSGIVTFLLCKKLAEFQCVFL